MKKLSPTFSLSTSRHGGIRATARVRRRLGRLIRRGYIIRNAKT